MQVRAVNNSNPNFGMAVKTTSTAERTLIENLTINGAKKFKALQEFATKDIVDVNIREKTLFIDDAIPSKGTYDQLIVDVDDGAQYSYEPLMYSWFIVNAIKKAVNKAHKLSEVQKILNN